MATHSSVLAWRISEVGESGGLMSMGCTESDTTEVTEQQQQQMRLQRMRVDRAPGDWLSSICQASGGEALEELQLSASGGAL